MIVNAFLREFQRLVPPTELERCRVVILTTTLLNLSFWQVQKFGGFWRMTIDHYEYNQVVNSITAATWMWYLYWSKSI